MRPSLTKALGFALCLAAAATVRPSAQTPTTTPASRPAAKAAVSPNDELIKLQIAGMDESILLATVAKTGPSKYDTSADALLKLKSAGVSQRVIGAILGVSTPGPVTKAVTPDPAPTTQRVVGSVEPPSTRSVEGREAGIYVDQGKGLVQLEPAVYSGGKGGNKIRESIPFVGKAVLKAVVRSAKADQRLHTSNPSFMFYFENKGSGLGAASSAFGQLNGASSPNEFILARLTVSKGERELILAEETHYNNRLGVKPEDTVDFSLEKLAPGVYKVTPKSPLTPGEYCFFPAGLAQTAGLTGKLFDFGVDVGATIQ